MNNGFFGGYEYNKNQSLGVNNTSLDIQDSYLYRYHLWDFMKKLYAVFDIVNMPESMSKRLIFNAVFGGGVGCVINTPKYGILFQPCTFRDVNVNYEPVYAVVSNPYMDITDGTYTIGKDTELLHFDLNYCSIYTWLDYFATLKSQLSAVLINQSRTLTNPYIFMCENPKIAKSFKAMAEKISDGEPFIFGDKNLFDIEGNLNVELFNKDFKKNLIIQDVYEILEEVEQSFLETIGVPRMYFKKRERMTDDEVNKNDVNTSLLRDSWLDCLNECCEKINKMFDISMKFEVSPNIVKGVESNENTPTTENLL